MHWFEPSRLRAALFQPRACMKLCTTCRSLMIGEASKQSIPNLEKLLKFHGFTPKTIPDVARSMGPMCEKCLANWSQELTAP
jgi:hypothetical protein